MVDLSKLDPATMARHLGKPKGEVGRVLADSIAERNCQSTKRDFSVSPWPAIA